MISEVCNKKIMITLMYVFVCLLLLELLFRGWLFFANRPQQPEKVRTEILDMANALTKDIPAQVNERGDPPPLKINTAKILHPFCGFVSTYKIESLSRHIKYFSKETREAEYNILVVGGSVAGSFCNREGREPFITTLKKDQRFANKRIVVLSHANGGHKQPQQATMVAFLFSVGYKPDAVINIDGFNEVALGFSNGKGGAFPSYPSFSHWAHLSRPEAFDPKALKLLETMRFEQERSQKIAEISLKYRFHYSGILGHLTLMWLSRARQNYVYAFQEYEMLLSDSFQKKSKSSLLGPTFDKSDKSILDSVVKSWFESSISIDAMCDARSIHYLHVLQPTLHDKGAKTITEEERLKGKGNSNWVAGALAGYPLLRLAGKKFQDKGVCFSDCSMVFRDVEETVYFDVCHFRGVGLDIFGKAVGEAFLKSLPNS
jgi:hypothetical protein